MKKGTLFTSCLLLFWGLLSTGVTPPVEAMDKEIVLGRGDLWQDVQHTDNLELYPGKWGSRDFLLRDSAYPVDGDTDLLLHFDRFPVQDSAGGYQPVLEDLVLSERNAVYGRSGAGFTGIQRGLHLRPGSQSLFSKDSFWEDVSIEFWLYPALLSDGEVIWSWVGGHWLENGDELITQRISCSIRNRTLRWRFENIFIQAETDKSDKVVQGITPLIPREWHHHLLRYDSTYGYLEYLVDGVPEAIIYTTDSGSEQGSLSTAHIGNASTGPIIIGEQLTGFVDELRFSRGFVDDPALTRYAGRTGEAVSRIFDLGYTGTRIKTIAAVHDQPDDSAVAFRYRVSDQLVSRNQLAADWTPFVPGEQLTDVRGRYVQIMFELFPNGSRSQSPQVSELRVIYEPDLPPAPPTVLRADPGNGVIRLTWNTVNEDDISGYLVYYGQMPGNYHGQDSSLGPSPIDVGNVTRVDLTGLTNGRLYYFTVVAYDSTKPAHRSLFSTEISSRPSPLTDP